MEVVSWVVIEGETKVLFLVLRDALELGGTPNRTTESSVVGKGGHKVGRKKVGAPSRDITRDEVYKCIK